jgi:Family of unknown function (DUF6279)
LLIRDKNVNLIRNLSRKHLLAGCAAAVLLLIGGCSMFKLAYNNVDIAINWTLDGYFDLQGEQHALLKARLEKLQTWHRNEELPAYVEGLKAIQARARQPFQRDDIIWTMDTTKKYYDRLIREAAPGAADLLVTITPEQIKTLEKKYAKNAQKFVKEHKLNGTPDEQRQARAKKMIEMLEEWVGNLSKEQEAPLRQTIESWPLNYPLLQEDRLRRQREFVSLLEKKSDAKLLAPQLTEWMIQFDQGRAPEYAAHGKQMTENFIQLILQTDRLINAKQRAHVIAKLQNYIDDFSALSHTKQASHTMGHAATAETIK